MLLSKYIRCFHINNIKRGDITMQISKNSINYLERILIAMIIVQIFFFFEPIVQANDAILNVQYNKTPFGFYSLAFGMNYGGQSISGDILWMIMLILPLFSLFVIIFVKKNRLIKYGVSAIVSLVELIGIKMALSVLNEQSESISTTLVDKTNIGYLFIFLLIVAIAVAVALIAANIGTWKSDANEIIKAANNQAVKMQSVINAYSNTKTCQNCGAVISGDSDFCSKCGTRYVAPAAKICPSCGAAIAQDDMFCKKCGTKYEPISSKSDGNNANESSVNADAFGNSQNSSDDISSDKIICPNCGETVRKGAKFCKKCGRAMDI